MLKEPINDGRRFEFRFYKNAGSATGNYIDIRTKGLNQNLLNTWQLITIPIADFNIPNGEQIERLEATFTLGSPNVVRDLYIDYIRLTTDVEQVIEPLKEFNVSVNGQLIGAVESINFIEDENIEINGTLNDKTADISIKANIDIPNITLQPAGSDTQIQYNNAGSFGADSNFFRDLVNNATFIANTDGADYLGGLQNDNGTSGIFSINTVTNHTIGVSANIGNAEVRLGTLNNGNGNLLTIDDENNSVTLAMSHTTQSPITFAGSGLDDLALYGKFSGTVPTTYTVTIDGVNQEFLGVDTSTISGGSFAVSDTVTNGTGGSADIVSISVIGDSTYLRVTINSGSFSNGNVIDNGSGVTGTLNNNQRTYDTVTYTDGVVTETNVPTFNEPADLVNGILFIFGADTGHTLSDSWTWTYSTVNQNVLDFSNNDYKFQSTFGIGTLGYQIGDNLLGFGITGSANTYTNVAGDFGFSGILNSNELTIGNSIQLATGETADSSLRVTRYNLSIRDALGIETQLEVISNNFYLANNNSSNINGIEFNKSVAGLLQLGNIYGGNGTKITIDDIAQTINFNNNYSFPFADGTAGQVLGTDGSGQLEWQSVSGGGGQIAFTKTKAEIDALIAGGNLVAGALYEITGVHPTLYNDGTTSGTTVYLRAISGSELEVQGMGKFYNPKYNQSVDGFGIWDNKMYGTFSNIVGVFDYQSREAVTANNAATGVLLADGMIQFVSGDWSAATSITGDVSGATADVADFVSPSYGIGDKVIWGGYRGLT